MLSELEISREIGSLTEQEKTSLFSEHLPISVSNVYESKNMGVAWEIHLWALEIENPFCYTYYDWFTMLYVWVRPDAQKLFLDKILSLLARAELVNLNKSK